MEVGAVTHLASSRDHVDHAASLHVTDLGGYHFGWKYDGAEFATPFLRFLYGRCISRASFRSAFGVFFRNRAWHAMVVALIASCLDRLGNEAVEAVWQRLRYTDLD